MKTQNELELRLEYKFFGEKIYNCFRKIEYYAGISNTEKHVKLIEDTIPIFEEKVYQVIPHENIVITRNESKFYNMKFRLGTINSEQYFCFDIIKYKAKSVFRLYAQDHLYSYYLGNYIHPVNFISDYGKMVEVFQEIYNSYPKWKTDFQSILTEHRKQIKKKELAETSIEVMLKNTFAGSGYKYDLLKNDRNVTLQIKLKKKKMLEVRLDHKNFAQQIKSVPEYLEKINKLVDDSPFAINIKTYGNGINWQEAK